MNTLKDYKFVLSLTALLLVVGVFSIVWQRANNALGSVTSGSEYYATSTKDHLGNTVSDLQVLKAGPGALGSVVITGANAGTFCLHDATTTNATLRTKTATSTVVCFPTSAAVGTYTFDSTFGDGLILDYVTGMATATITWR